MNLKRENKADKHVVVGSLEVIGDIKGSGIQTIQKNIDALSKSVSTTAAKQENYWKALADDSIISPVEKRTLKQEWNTIEQTYASLITLARENGVDESVEIRNYMGAYSNLYDYLTRTLKVFDDMGTDTAVPDRDVFESFFEEYYYNQTLAQNKVVVKQNLNVRILEDLDGPGTENEIASYKGVLYMYDTRNARWKALDTASYLGPKGAEDDFPPAMNGSYFLAVDDTLKAPIILEDGRMLLANGLPLIANATVTAGNIYLCGEDGAWQELKDRDNWRYIVAMNDLLKYNFSVSHQIGNFIEKNVEERITDNIPKYLGPITTTSQLKIYNNGDWFTWRNEKTIWQYTDDKYIELKTGQVYKFNKPTWQQLNPAETKYNNEFMTALIDIVNINGQEDGYFSTIFVKKLFALEAAIQTLQTKVITLTDGGKIESQAKDKNGSPLTLIDDKGNFHFGDEKNYIEYYEGTLTIQGSIKALSYQVALEAGVDYTLKEYKNIGMNNPDDDYYVPNGYDRTIYTKFNGTGAVLIDIEDVYDPNNPPSGAILLRLRGNFIDYPSIGPGVNRGSIIVDINAGDELELIFRKYRTDPYHPNPIYPSLNYMKIRVKNKNDLQGVVTETRNELFITKN